jgi:hypothetical protein
MVRRGVTLSLAGLLTALDGMTASAAVPPEPGDFDPLIPFLATGQLSEASAGVAALTQGVLNDMAFIKLKTAAGLLAATAILAGSGWAVKRAMADKPDPPEKSASVAAAPAEPHPSKLDLSPDSFAKFRELVRPADNEWRHLRVKWLTDIVAARKKAAKEDKAIIIFRTGGAGYNDPLGVC